PPCLVGLEACATAHYWARELRALGHEVRLMPAQHVKAYIKRQQARCRRCGSDLRGGSAPDDALWAGPDGQLEPENAFVFGFSGSSRFFCNPLERQPRYLCPALRAGSRSVPHAGTYIHDITSRVPRIV